MPWNFCTIASATSAVGMARLATVSGRSTCGPKTGLTANSSVRHSAQSAPLVAWKATTSRVARSCSVSPSSGMAAARAANSRAAVMRSSSAARLTSS